MRWEVGVMSDVIGYMIISVIITGSLLIIYSNISNNSKNYKDINSSQLKSISYTEEDYSRYYYVCRMLDLLNEIITLNISDSEKLNKIDQYIVEISHNVIKYFIVNLYCGYAYLPSVEEIEDQSLLDDIELKTFNDRREINNTLSRITYNLYNNKKD